MLKWRKRIKKILPFLFLINETTCRPYAAFIRGCRSSISFAGSSRSISLNTEVSRHVWASTASLFLPKCHTARASFELGALSCHITPLATSRHSDLNRKSCAVQRAAASGLFQHGGVNIGECIAAVCLRASEKAKTFPISHCSSLSPVALWGAAPLRKAIFVIS